MLSTLGPGQYNANPMTSSELRNPPRVFIAGKNNQEGRFVSPTPSPLEYSPSMKFIKKHSPAFKIGTQV